MLIICIIIFFIGLVFNYHGSGHILTGLSMILISFWLFRYDIAFKSLKMTGLHRYIAVNLISGYSWLLLSGLLLMVTPTLKYIYDATIHAFFLGFTFLMIFAHGPIILPGIAKINIKPYHPFLYFWGAVLQISLLIRLLTDFAEITGLREIAGLLNMISIIGFFLNVLYLMKVKGVRSG